MSNEHGGKRENAGRPKGSSKISTELRNQFREHTETAVTAIVAIAKDSEHQHHLKACELILSRGYGTVTATNESEDIVSQFIGGEITAIQAGLLLESKGLRIGGMLQQYINNEFRIESQTKPFSMEHYPLPKS